MSEVWPQGQILLGIYSLIFDKNYSVHIFILVNKGIISVL